MHSHHHNHHHHSRSHGHHAEVKSGQNIFAAFLLNLIFSIVEFVGGILTGSVAIQTDALHDLGDALGLGSSWLLEKLSHRRASSRLTFGYLRLRVLGAVITMAFLLFGSIFMIHESLHRLLNPKAVQVEGMLFLAVLGVVVNLMAYFKLKRGGTLIERAMVLHMLEDAAGWVIVLLGALIMYWGGPVQLDALISLGLAFWVLYRVYLLAKEVFDILMQSAPSDLDHLLKHIEEIPQIANIHHIHAWSIDGSSHVLSMHVTVVEALNWNDLGKLKKQIRSVCSDFGQFDLTLEFEHQSEECLSPVHKN